MKSQKKTSLWVKIMLLVSAITAIGVNFIPIWLYKWGNSIEASHSVFQENDYSGIIAGIILFVIVGASIILKRRWFDVLTGIAGILISGFFLLLSFALNYFAQNSYVNQWGIMHSTPGVAAFFVVTGLIFISSILVLAIRKKVGSTSGSGCN